jgi:lipopolysaccharide export system protein LptA
MRAAAELFVTVGLVIGLAAAAVPARAEKADRDKPLNIESDRMNADDARKTAVFEGRVILTQGTLVIRADRLTLRQDKDGYQYGTATGNLATFRQKRDGANEYIDGEAERIEYDGRAETVQFFERAHLRRDAGDDVRGNFISYNARTENFSVQSSKEQQASGDSRVRAVIMPRKRDDAVAPPAPARP